MSGPLENVIEKNMAAKKLGEDNTGDPGTAFKLVVRVCGLAVIAGIFLPFLLSQSVLTLGEQLGGYGGVWDNLKGMLSGSTVMGSITKCVLLSAFVFFPILGISMVLRAKYAGGPLTFLILFNLAAFLLVLFCGSRCWHQRQFLREYGPGLLDFVWWPVCAVCGDVFLG
jgi:hypothetical protein